MTRLQSRSIKGEVLGGVEKRHAYAHLSVVTSRSHKVAEI